MANERCVHSHELQEGRTQHDKALQRLKDQRRDLIEDELSYNNRYHIKNAQEEGPTWILGVYESLDTLKNVPPFEKSRVGIGGTGGTISGLKADLVVAEGLA